MQLADIGSPSYMSPEQVKSAPLDYHSDMFTLGVVLYQLFTGQRPFVASTLEELFKKVLGEVPAPPSSLRPELSQDIDEILLQMMAKKPDDRYPSWADLALDIAKVGRLSVYQSAIPDSEKFLALKAVRLLSQLDDAELWSLCSPASGRGYRRAQPLCTRARPGKACSFSAAGMPRSPGKVGCLMCSTQANASASWLT